MFRVARTCLKRVLKADPSLVCFPSGVRCCEVFRNVVTLDEEERIYEELSRVLSKEGQALLLEGSTPTSRRVKHVYLEMFGLDKEFTEVKNWHKREVRRLPGLMWSPTLLDTLSSLPPHIVDDMPDTARVLEHNMAGYEMHVEHPTVGSSFLYLNLLSDTVLEFDDEVTERRGQVFLPARSLMRVSGEARWGFRFGERTEETHTFLSARGGARRRVETDMRLSVQLWKLSPQLLDSRLLEERIEESIAMVRQGRASTAADAEEKKRDEEDAMMALTAPGSEPSVQLTPQESSDPLQTFMTGLAEKTDTGKGVLGGDLGEDSTAGTPRIDSTKLVSGVREDYDRYKKQFSNVYGILQDMKAMQDAGSPIDDVFLKRKLDEASHVEAEGGDKDGFDAVDIEGTWDRVDAKARFYKAKLKKMDYDGTAFLNSTMPDISKDAPLDMRATIEKMAPHVKDGDKILASLPNGQR